MTLQHPDLYTFIHKAIRLALGDFLALFGATDAADAAEWARAERHWAAIKGLLLAHTEHEDRHIHPIIHRVAPDIAARLDAQHEALDALVLDIDRRIGGMSRLSAADARRSEAGRIYRLSSSFIARYFEHLLEEETAAAPALLSACTVEELVGAHHRIVGSISPQERLAGLPWFARALTPPERIAMMRATQAGAPPAFFDEACRVMAGVIGEEAFRPIAEALAPKAA